MAAPAPLSPLAPKSFPDPPPIGGVRFATIEAGVRYAGRTDVMMAVFDRPAAVAGVLTRSQCPSAPVDWCRAHLPEGRARAFRIFSMLQTPLSRERSRERERSHGRTCPDREPLAGR